MQRRLPRLRQEVQVPPEAYSREKHKFGPTLPPTMAKEKLAKERRIKEKGIEERRTKERAAEERRKEQGEVDENMSDASG
jgi:hypothetical protein